MIWTKSHKPCFRNQMKVIKNTHSVSIGMQMETRVAQESGWRCDIKKPIIKSAVPTKRQLFVLKMIPYFRRVYFSNILYGLLNCFNI